jgi:hypothetical protein
LIPIPPSFARRRQVTAGGAFYLAIQPVRTRLDARFHALISPVYVDFRAGRTPNLDREVPREAIAIFERKTPAAVGACVALRPCRDTT